jgi:hypothetical protein
MTGPPLHFVSNDGLLGNYERHACSACPGKARTEEQEHPWHFGEDSSTTVVVPHDRAMD